MLQLHSFVIALYPSKISYQKHNSYSIHVSHYVTPLFRQLEDRQAVELTEASSDICLVVIYGC